MLQFIRSTAGSWVVKILFFFLIVSFAVWGVGDMTSGWASRNVAEVGDVEITPEEFTSEFRREVNQLRQMFGPQFTEEQAVQLGLHERTLQQLVQRALLTQAARDIGLRAGDETVVSQIREVPAFQNQFGQFDPEVMRFVLRQNGYTEQGFVAMVRSDLERGHLLGAVGGGARAPETLAAAMFRFRGERRIADLIAVPAASMPEPAAPTDEVLAAYHESYATRYTAPEYRAITIATLTADDLAGDITVSDAELQDAYEARSYEFITPERRDIVQVVAPDEATARAVLDAATAGQPLEQAAAASGLDTVELPGSTRETLPTEMVEPVYAAETGAVAGPVETLFGWHVFTVAGVTPGGEQTLEEVREQLLADVRRDKAIGQLFEVANTMDDRLAGGASLEEAAQAVGAGVTRFEQVDAQGRTPDGTQVQGPANLPQILERAFRLREGETSNLIEAGEDAYFATAVENVVPPAVRPLETIRDQVLADWQAEQRMQAAASKAEELVDRLREGADPTALAAEIPNAAHVRTEPLTREADQRGPIPPAVRESLFDLAAGDATTIRLREAYVVARLVEIVPADPLLGADQVAQIRTAAEEAISNDLIQQYLEGLRGRHPVQQNRAILDSLIQR